MSFDQLPYEIQFQYLLEAPVRAVLNYCETSTAANLICQTDQFWNAKALQDYGIPLSVFSEGTPKERYAMLVYQMDNNIGQFLFDLMHDGHFDILARLISEMGLLAIPRGHRAFDVLIAELLDEAADTGRYDLVKGLMDIYAPVFNTYLRTKPQLIYDFVRTAFFDAVLAGYTTIVDLLKPYYDPSRDTSDVLDSWIGKWQQQNNPVKLQLLFDAGVRF